MAIDVYKGMNERQREAIDCVKGPLLVVAGAGSGKTRVITHRIANIVQQGTAPDRILAITFTNKAAREMKDRVHALLHVQTPWITTFHSAGLRIMKQELAAFGFRDEFTILDEDDQLRLYKEAYKVLKLDPKAIDPRKVQWTISRWKNELIDISKIEPNDDGDATAQKVHVVYEQLCKDQNKVDFDDLLVRPVVTFERDAELRKRWVARFPYLLIDEYQDTNKVQYKFIRLLGESRNICSTGDPDQAIYGWRGADIANILSFEKDFPDCKKVLLEQNYRSTKVILRAAQGVVSNNTLRENKTIRTDNTEGKPLTLLAVDDELDESYAVSAAIERMQRDDRKWEDFAVFYRTNAQSRILEDGLRRRGIPYRIVGGFRFYDRAEVKDLLAYLKLMINGSDRAAFTRMAEAPKRGIGERTLGLVFQLADDELVTPCEILERDDLLERLAIGRSARPLQELSRVWRILRRFPRAKPADLVRAVLDHAQLEEHYRKSEESAKAEDMVANIREVVTAAEQYHETYPDGGLSGFLDLVALNTEAGAREERSGEVSRVTLMTLHAAKGLEFNVVFITACEENIFPLARAGVINDLEEERRLMYVGITRAREELYLSRARLRMLYGQTNRNAPSRFLDEIPQDCFEMKDATGRRPLPPERPARGPHALAKAFASGALVSGASLKRRSAADDDDEVSLLSDPWPPGSAVTHRVFGAGSIVRYHGPAEARTVVIGFGPGIGEKELQLAFAAAKITPL